MPVTATGSTTSTLRTTSEGCAFFAYLPAGTYTVSATQTGWVGAQEQTTPSQSVSVTVGTTQSVQFYVDHAATITDTGWSPAVPAAATGVPVSVGNNGLQPYHLFSFAAGTTSLTPLYPYTSGYELFAGNCTDADPLGVNTSGTRFYPSATSTVIPVSPGGSASGTVPLYSLTVKVTDTLGVPVGGATVQATATGGTCPAGNPVFGLATTLVVTGLSVTGVPLGHLTINVTSGTKHGSVKVWQQPGGTYAVDGSGNATTLYGATGVPVTVS
jgi:hypothetical protein